MGENVSVENAPKKSWYKGLKAEFNKIIWPDQKSLVKQTTAVVAISIILGLIISMLDAVIKYGIDFLVK
ncbi:protein translocase subunit secE/sec61 gamma [Lachnotalea glycerini]|jgi:preprotein translocase subunit SecE|uniref:Preprotein translocase subunit SecE n=1 Tax=Lachnotalea glycerini TaxID=1763509 RepID=A0A255LKM6_9FIRM|nr:preprotein translocase subunit SecE [Lachnotalea glycerini]OYO76184.1 preprotein translocase subunit SecE [Lachnotalea glycerini]PXV90208.1 protein translocase subunit secE/sec61 gamma [Lachnotalea glycerini]RDY30604.1 preprotein translocase subunit SecE [Lachnotalea glycerini]